MTFTWKISWSSKKRTRRNRPLQAAPLRPHHNLQNNYKSAPWKLKLVFRGALGSILFLLDLITYALFHRASLIPALAPPVSAALSPLEAERHSSVEWPPAVFQIDAGDKCPRWRAPGEQISQAGSVAREVCASGPL